MKRRHTIYLDDEASTKLERLTRKADGNKSSAVALAIRHFSHPSTAPIVDPVLRSRLDRMTRDNGRIRRDLAVLMEGLAFYVRLYLTFNAHTPIPDQAGKAVAQERYRKFVEQVARQLASGTQSFGVHEPTEPEAASSGTAAASHQEARPARTGAGGDWS